MKLAISLGGDSDTIAAMAASVAQAYYGDIPSDMVQYCRDLLLAPQRQVLDDFWTRLASRAVFVTQAQPQASSTNGGVARQAKWYYWLDRRMGRKEPGWHLYDVTAHKFLEDMVQGQPQPQSTATLQSGKFAYRIDLHTMTQCNQSTGTVRRIRRVLAGESFDVSAPPVIVSPPARATQPVAQRAVAIVKPAARTAHTATTTTVQPLVNHNNLLTTSRTTTLNKKTGATTVRKQLPSTSPGGQPHHE